MTTWGKLKTKFQTMSGDDSAAALAQAEEDMNTGNALMHAALNNYFNRRSKAADIVADQQYYQLPADCVRVQGIDFLESTDHRRPLVQIRSEYAWRSLNSAATSGNTLTNWFQKGADEVGVFPIPSQAVTSGLIIYYDPKSYNFNQDDYTTGTVALTQGSTTVTGTDTAFTSSMVGWEFSVTDGSDGYQYRVAAYVSGTEITLEEPFVGVSGSGKTFLLGQAPTFPSEYHNVGLHYALGMFFQTAGNMERAKFHMSGDYKRPGLFEAAINDARARYASSSSSSVITGDSASYDPWRDNTRTIAE